MYKENILTIDDTDIGYELWDRGYRINANQFSEAKFREYWKAASQVGNLEDISFDAIFQVLVTVHPDWFVDEMEEEKKYRLENEPKLRKYFMEHFFGRKWEEIESDETLYECWGFYSDWHKDVYGYRPHGIVCGVYINPHKNN